MNQDDLFEEQKRVDTVITYIDECLRKLDEQLSDREKDVIYIKKNFWEDVTVNLDNDEEKAETFSSIKQQADLLSERERSQKHDANQYKKLERLKDSPYFGRIDFIEEGETKAEQIYIGISSLVNEDGYDFYIYDWRAPISSMYYDYGPGEASYQTPAETITGEITVKKQMLIRQGEVKHVFETGVTIGDDVLQEVLGNQSSSQMKSIVSTIQQEQNQIIRNEKGKILVVNGVAGSGKTSVAMQRVAYLLYRYREQMNADQVILFSPNALFNQYVAQVLPELGEENMQQTTFQAYLEHRLSTEWRIEDSYDQLEYVLTRQHDSDYFQRLESIGIKSSLVFMDELDRYFQSLQQKGLLFRDINFRGQRLFQANWIQEHFYKIDQSLSTPHRLEILIDILLKHLDIFEKEERKKNWVLEEVEQLSVEVIQSVFKRVERESDGYMDELRQEQLLRALVVRRKLKPIRAFIQQARFLDLSMLYKDFLQNIQRQLFSNYLYFNEVIDTTIQRLQNRQLYYEDMTPYLYLKSMIEGFEVNMAIRHVLIDEAQDYSPFQLSYILKLFPKARFTILGDLNQAIYAHSYQSKSFQLFSSNLFDGKVETYSLTKSYRSTRQIMELANRIIQSDIEPFNRTGVKPTLIKIDNEKERCKEIIQLVKKTNANSDRKLAIICKSDQQAYIAYKQLKEQLDVTYVKKDTTEVSNSVIVTPAYLAKGMEYDHVIVYDASSDSYAEEKDRNMIYITCTRAMHTLHLFYQGELSSLLPDQESGLYMTNFN